MKTKHTELPWHIDNYGGVKAPGMKHGFDNVRINGFALNTGPRCHEAEANTEFIVRACNSHDQLLAALKDALAVIRDYLEYEHDGDPWTEDARAMGEMDIDDYKRDGRLDRAEAALAAAGEQP